MNGSDRLALLFVKNLIGLNQLENAQRAAVLKLIREAFGEVNSLLINDYDDLTKFQKNRQQALYKRTGQILVDAYGDVAKAQKGDLFDLSQYSSRFAEKVITTVVATADVEYATTRLTRDQLAKIVELPVQGFTRSEWWLGQAANMSSTTKRQIQLGLFQGESIGSIIKRVKDTTERASTEAKAIVRTSVTGVQSETHFETFKKQGDDLTEEYEYVATLDSRTTIICASLDGKRFRYDDDQAPRPPQHINCRSTIVPVVNWEGLGVDKATVKQLDSFQRAATGGPTKYKTYETWLKNQSADVQREVLGATRAQLFRSGEASLKDLIDSDGSVITVQELAKQFDLDL